MSPTQIVAWMASAVLAFWVVGAYNRLLRLRNDIARSFALVEAQVQHHDALLQRWLATLRPSLENAPPSFDALEVACRQLVAACQVAHARPSGAWPVASLRLAADILMESRTRVHADLAAHPELLADAAVVALGEELAAADNALSFVRRQFNETTQTYNDALEQFPTWIVAGMFHFHGAGTL